jgi:hypothetical protein
MEFLIAILAFLIGLALGAVGTVVALAGLVHRPF